MYKSKYFKIQELVDPAILAELGEEACWAKFRPIVLMGLDLLREELGVPLTINGVFLGQTFTESGVRRKDTPTGAKLSAHKNWEAFDLKSKEKTPEQIQAHIKANYARYGITRLEASTPSWTHADWKVVPLVIVPFQ